MAIILGTNISPYRPAVSSSDSDVVSVIGRHVVTVAEAAAAAAGDVISLVKLPANTKIVDAVASSSVAESGTADTVNLVDVAGVAVPASLIVTAGTVLDAVGIHRMDNAQALNLAPQAVETYASVTLGAATPGLTAGTVVSLELRYRAAWLGD